MPIQIIPYSAGGLDQAGQITGGGLSNILQDLAAAKVNQIQQRNAMKNIHQAFPELDQGSLAFLASQPAKQQMEYLRNYSSGLQNLQEQQQAQQLAQQQQLQELSQQQQQPSIPYAPGFKGPKQANFGGQEQQQREQQIQQLQQDLVKPQSKLSLGEALGASPKLGGVSEKQQLQIEKSNKPFLKLMNDVATSAKTRKESAQKALDLVRSGKVTSGILGNLPESVLGTFSTADSDYLTIINKLANEKALKLRGPVGKAKIEAAQREKATLNKPTESKQHILIDEIKESNKEIAFEEAYKQVLEENNNVEPANIEQKIRQKAPSIEKKLNDEFEYSLLPDPSEYKEKEVIEVEESKNRYQKRDGGWVKL